jgi:phage repressor protein C with HTH and peptisase S24 domain
MEPRINDGDFCVFRANPAGSRQGKIVLVQHANYYDSDYSGAYSIKEYSSKKSYDEFGNWQHEKIELTPLNKDYNSIVIAPEDGEEFRVVGEFVGVINN